MDRLDGQLSEWTAPAMIQARRSSLRRMEADEEERR